ncbi:RNA polymerase sigma factor SigJ [Prosthecobacter sp. SYSU 5D2]|uniref:RNA polymerase sigma factor SigJ n=1 Tax=Prosthecobacter sp. SYSU 5D2 TaxID=3134134 RepID=UPI0031FF0DEA
MEEQARLFEQHRSLLLGIAYRMTGVLAEAQDVVQDTWVKWSRAELAKVRDARAWLVTACSRQALDVLKSARRRRESYCGVWLPEPFHETTEDGGPVAAGVDESVSMALMLALEKLSPAERAAFLLHDVFGHEFDEIAVILGKSGPACRKLASRARAAVQAARPRFETRVEDHQRLLEAFLKAAYAGELQELKSLLAESVEMRSDGGGKVSALPDIMRGVDAVARFLVGVMHHRPQAHEGRRLVPCRFNGAPGILIHEGGRLVTALTIDVEAGRIQAIYAVRNPDKLRGLEGV